MKKKRPLFKMPTKAQMEKVKKYYESFHRDVASTLDKVQEDALIYGSGYMEMLADGGLRHVPYRELFKTKRSKKKAGE